MTIRPIPQDQAESREMGRTGRWRGQTLCAICGENVANTTYKGDPACRVCVRELAG